MIELSDEQLNQLLNAQGKRNTFTPAEVKQQLKNVFRIGVERGWEEGYADGKWVAENNNEIIQ